MRELSSRARRVLAWFLGDDGDCPVCAGGLVEQEPGHHLCSTCGVVVDFARGGWSFPGGVELRRLPGLLGVPWDRDREAA